MSARRLLRVAASLGAALLSGALAGPVARPLAAQAPEPGASLRISVLTFGQGDEVFERFGHNALRVRDTATGEDLAYNWGMFSFDQPNFLGRFLSGDTKYWVEAFPTDWLVQNYVGHDRETIEQVLALTPTQAAAIAAFVRENAREEKKYYRYDYFRDNCSTRLRDALDVALGGSLQRRFAPIASPWTYRSEALRLMTPDGLVQAGMDVALGPRADLTMSAWEAMYVPMRLRDYLREVTVPVAAGGTEPLVREEIALYRATARAPEPVEHRGLSIGAWGPILGAWMLILAPVSAAARRRTRVPAAVMAVLWYGLTGLLGAVLVGMWFGSAHVFWYRNLNLLLLSPLGLVAAVPAMLAILRGHAPPLARGLAIAIAASALLALLLAPFVSQRLGGPLLLLLPAHAGLAIAFWRHTRADTARPAAAPGSPA